MICLKGDEFHYKWLIQYDNEIIKWEAVGHTTYFYIYKNKIQWEIDVHGPNNINFFIRENRTDESLICVDKEYFLEFMKLHYNEHMVMILFEGIL